MITVSVNGQLHSIAEGSTMSALLAVLGMNQRYCAVEQNRQIVLRENHEQQKLADGDTIEIVTLVGGG